MPTPTNLKPFDLEAAKAGKPILICGLPGKFLLYEPTAVHEQRIICVDSKGRVRVFPLDGAVLLSMAPTKREGWVNVYPVKRDGKMVAYTDGVYETEILANDNAANGCVACVRVEWEE